MSLWRLYADGACTYQTGAGGWAYILQSEDGSMRDFGASSGKTTNNRMELCAILGGLLQVPDGQPVKVYTDSKYSRDCLTKWWKQWQSNGWTTQAGKPVENKELIQRVLKEMRRIGDVQVQLVPRNSIKPMEEADALAKAGKLQFKQEKGA